MSLKKNATVRWQSPRSGRNGTGKIREILPTTRGAWYEVEDAETKSRIRLRAAHLTPVA